MNLHSSQPQCINLVSIYFFRLRHNRIYSDPLCARQIKCLINCCENWTRRGDGSSRSSINNANGERCRFGFGFNALNNGCVGIAPARCGAPLIFINYSIKTDRCMWHEFVVFCFGKLCGETGRIANAWIWMVSSARIPNHSPQSSWVKPKPTEPTAVCHVSVCVCVLRKWGIHTIAASIISNQLFVNTFGMLMHVGKCVDCVPNAPCQNEPTESRCSQHGQLCMRRLLIVFCRSRSFDDVRWYEAICEVCDATTQWRKMLKAFGNVIDDHRRILNATIIANR